MTKELTVTLENQFKYRNGTSIYKQIPIIEKGGFKTMELMNHRIDTDRFTQLRE